jgi:hypothetical protein
MTASSQSTMTPFSWGRTGLQSAAAFGFAGSVAVAVFAILGRNDPVLRLPDLCMFGMLFGAPAAVGAAFYTMFETFVRQRIVVDFLYFGLLTLWSLTLWTYGLVAPEGIQLGIFLAAGSMTAGTIGWPLCRFRIPTWFTVGASLLGIALVATYFVVASRLGSH